MYSKAQVRVRANLEPPEAYEVGGLENSKVLHSLMNTEHFSKQFKGASPTRQPLVIIIWFKTGLSKVNDFP